MGREHALDALDRALDKVVDHGVRVVLVHGEAGIGKTALLHRFCAGHPDLRVFWGSGEKSQPGASFTLIGRLFGSVGVRGFALLAHTARTLPAEEPIEVGRRVLQALSGLGGKHPITLVVDDAHQADLASLRALLFALRRLSTHPVLAILVARSEKAGLPEGLVRLAECQRTGLVLPLGPMRPVDVQGLAAAFGVPDMPLRDASRACAHARGNPRQIVALLAELPVDAWSQQSRLPAPRSYSRVIRAKLDACTDEARRLVEVASVLGDHADLSIASVLADVDEPLVALEEACLAGLLSTPPPASLWRLRFPEPLVQAAVYGQLGPLQRARLHRAAAGLVEDRRAAQQHRALATQSCCR